MPNRYRPPPEEAAAMLMETYGGGGAVNAAGPREVLAALQNAPAPYRNKVLTNMGIPHASGANVGPSQDAAAPSTQAGWSPAQLAHYLSAQGVPPEQIGTILQKGRPRLQFNLPPGYQGPPNLPVPPAAPQANPNQLKFAMLPTGSATGQPLAQYAPPPQAMPSVVSPSVSSRTDPRSRLHEPPGFAGQESITDPKQLAADIDELVGGGIRAGEELPEDFVPAGKVFPASVIEATPELKNKQIIGFSRSRYKKPSTQALLNRFRMSLAGGTAPGGSIR